MCVTVFSRIEWYIFIGPYRGIVKAKVIDASYCLKSKCHRWTQSVLNDNQSRDCWNHLLLDMFLVLYRVEHVNVICSHVIKEQTIQLMYKTSNILII